MLGHSHPDLEEAGVRIAWVEDGANDRWRTLVDLGLSSSDMLEPAGISPVNFLGALLGSDQPLPFFEGDPSEAVNGTVVEVEGIRDGKKVNIKTLMDFAKAQSDPTSTAARLGVEALLDGQVTGDGVLTPEVGFDPASFIENFSRESHVALIQQTITVGRLTD